MDHVRPCPYESFMICIYATITVAFPFFCAIVLGFVTSNLCISLCGNRSDWWHVFHHALYFAVNVEQYAYEGFESTCLHTLVSEN